MTRAYTKNLIIIALMTAIMCVLAPVSIPLFFTPVPISLGVFIVYIISYVLSPSYAVVSVFIYILLGLFGLPVFSGYAGGAAKLFGPTGGYIIGYLFSAFIVSYFVRLSSNRLLHLLGMLLGLAACYAFGTVWFSLVQHMDFLASLKLCVIPFLPGDCIKIILALIVGPELVKRINV